MTLAQLHPGDTYTIIAREQLTRPDKSSIKVGDILARQQDNLSYDLEVVCITGAAYETRFLRTHELRHD